ncbi:FtsL-like putative cell division protein [Prevotella sp. OH937_COT-195]|uniref:FtsL-like putative cell division protein n=1 Tax=Prevotella sp. OH937_COT-195 TaxID=2491051 RepID=UPI001F3CABF3|nr:FtsL-like putative cell division protein [Prevotella sp. OH937_COT-195]
MTNKDEENKILAEAEEIIKNAEAEEIDMTEQGTPDNEPLLIMDNEETQEEKDEKEKDKEEKERKKKEKENKEMETLALTISNQAREDEEPLSKVLSLRKILGGDFFTAEFMKKNVGVIILIVLFTLLYVANRYSCQNNLLEIDKLNKELQDSKYKALSSASELTEKCRETHVLEMLKNNNNDLLKQAEQPPYIINVEGK